MTATSCRIELAAGKKIRISRVQPSAMTNYMTSSSWTSFCDKIDEALMPLDRVKRNHLLSFIAFVPLNVALMIIAYFLTTRTKLRVPVVTPTVLVLLGMAGMIGVKSYAEKRLQKVLQCVEAICEDTSNQYSQISFHVKFDHILLAVAVPFNQIPVSHRNSGQNPVALNYIEVTFADIEASSAVSYSHGDGGLGGPSALSLTVAESLLGGEQKSVAARLRDLDEKMNAWHAKPGGV
eukprot:CAMPEP_0178706930 /NCGR_PEP_ID=MMETSP0699-20121125/15700_1 /TAXON_ID=265572 /ORGANISM="Extubocellulus spinifer, Strain CCMP396" /LENGTH=235 /DNA_ID=CAMNT_0020354825 /DNA_START=316 /DNA_END=1023 /DNA_ORIENTATION=-